MSTDLVQHQSSNTPMLYGKFSSEELDAIFDRIRADVAKQREEPTPDATTEKGQGKKYRKGRGGKTWAYISGMDAQLWLDEHYPGWSWEESLNYVLFADHVYTSGTLTVIHPSTGLPRKMTCVGCDAAEYDKNDSTKLVVLQYVKGAATDALKRAAHRLGGFTDVYTEFETEKLPELHIDPEDLLYYFQTIFPKAIERLKHDPAILFNQIEMFKTGQLTIEKLRAAYL